MISSRSKPIGDFMPCVPVHKRNPTPHFQLIVKSNLEANICKQIISQYVFGDIKYHSKNGDVSRYPNLKYLSVIPGKTEYVMLMFYKSAIVEELINCVELIRFS